MRKVFIVTDGSGECWHDSLECAETTLECENEYCDLKIIEREVSEEEYLEVMNREFDGF